MNIKLVISVFLLFANITVQAAGALPQGRWTIEKITVEKNSDGTIQTTEYGAAADVKSHIRCPQEWEVNAQSMVLRYPNGAEETASYALDGNRLTIFRAVAKLSYQYEISEGNMILTAQYNYVNNRPAGDTEHISEKWIITLKK